MVTGHEVQLVKVRQNGKDWLDRCCRMRLFSTLNRGSGMAAVAL